MENSISQDLVGGSPSELNDYVKGGIEALMFVSEKPVTLDQIKNVFETVSAADIKQTLQLLKNEYEQRHSGMTIVEIAGGYQMLSNPVYASYIRDFYKTKHKEKLSKPALETLAIVSYKQPVSRADIELIRGVNSDGVVTHLLNKELIKIVGRKDVPGKPYLYGTTRQFLEYFGLRSLNDLPRLEEFPMLQPSQEAIDSLAEQAIAPAVEAHEEKTAVVIQEVSEATDSPMPAEPPLSMALVQSAVEENKEKS
ncbi:MAG TPA: SMC-Scp complex subunit ScpB [Candidatus Omnitrophica bacterium]|nr:MAG: SMC-Scp complex subunit ScpB [Omnitrophica WOR_2 bacterium GWA2_45_18]OGX19977.1 MAG: SMC-Scp complex subunit ScpB [Omnitrophica WOR_2 bacterium GWC2_45_7]HBR14749.1 SMC-Scp complex subunit ScpB [Candidatus Omnitrophota bacterium]